LIIVEDGSIVTDAESYCTLAFANTYHANRGNTAWDALDDIDDKEPALRKATEYMGQVYRLKWLGLRADDDQALDWPRIGVVTGDEITIDDDVVPLEVQRACAELALKAASGALLSDLTQQKVMVKIGSITSQYDPYSPQYKRYPAIDGMLSAYLLRRGQAVRA
jgi:hypothetical protein